MILTLSNFISFLRAPLAFVFLSDSLFFRGFAIVLAMVTDALDGYLARRFRSTSPLGAFLDPLMDKFFVFFIVGVLLSEEKLAMWEALALISRDFAVLIFGCFLIFQGSWSNFQFRAIWSGKVTTSLQFFVLLGLTFHIAIPLYLFWCFIVLGLLALFELYFIEREVQRTQLLAKE